MVKSTIFDMAIDEVLKRQLLVTDELARRGKGKKPFRTVPMSEDEQVEEYLSLDPRVVEELRQDIPSWAEHEQKVRELIMRRMR